VLFDYKKMTAFYVIIRNERFFKDAKAKIV